ncbi:MAG: hypothetical protein OCD01_07410 [Fibrobacterales bacterium]
MLGITFSLKQPSESKEQIETKVEIINGCKKPRLIIVGGSNTGLGLNSEVLHDSLPYNVVNAGTMAGFGLKYMLDNVSEVLDSGDVVLVLAEYENYFGDFFWGELPLMYSLENYPYSLKFLNSNQVLTLGALIPKFFRIRLMETIKKVVSGGDVGLSKDELERRKAFNISAYNAFGDMSYHWDIEKEFPFSHVIINGDINFSAIEYLHEVERKLKQMNGQLLIGFPAYNKNSYENERTKIDRIESLLWEEGFSVVGKSIDYSFERYYHFDSQYHLNKKGIDIRMKQLLSDLRSILTARN